MSRADELYKATCRDILALIRLVRATVLEQTGVTLEPEVRLLGCALAEATAIYGFVIALLLLVL